MAELTITPIPNPDSKRWADFGKHIAVYNGVCGDCGPLIYKGASYEAYLDHWYANEYEGDPNQQPDSREVYEYIRDSCYARQVS